MPEIIGHDLGALGKYDATVFIDQVSKFLGVLPSQISEISVVPTRIIVTVFKLNEQGRKYVDLESDGPDYGYAAREIHILHGITYVPEIVAEVDGV